jgi:hypothetical protein
MRRYVFPSLPTVLRTFLFYWPVSLPFRADRGQRSKKIRDITQIHLLLQRVGAVSDFAPPCAIELRV